MIKQDRTPLRHPDGGFATAGTTITPFMQLYVQSAVVDRGIGVDELNAERAEVASGSIFANLVASFIIIATGATLFVHGMLLPVTLVFVWRLASNEELMGKYKNGRIFNAVAVLTVFATSALSLLLLGVTFAGKA